MLVITDRYSSWKMGKHIAKDQSVNTATDSGTSNQVLEVNLA